MFKSPVLAMSHLMLILPFDSSMLSHLTDWYGKGPLMSQALKLQTLACLKQWLWHWCGSLPFKSQKRWQTPCIRGLKLSFGLKYPSIFSFGWWTLKSAPQLFTEWLKNNTSFGHTLAKPQNTTGDHTLTAFRAFSPNNYFMSSIRALYWQIAISWWGWWREGSG